MFSTSKKVSLRSLTKILYVIFKYVLYVKKNVLYVDYFEIKSIFGDTTSNFLYVEKSTSTLIFFYLRQYTVNSLQYIIVFSTPKTMFST